MKVSDVAIQESIAESLAAVAYTFSHTYGQTQVRVNRLIIEIFM